jgi:hypothetical protein
MQQDRRPAETSRAPREGCDWRGRLMPDTKRWLRSVSIAVVLSTGPRAVLAGEPPGSGSSAAPEPDKPRPHHPEPRVIVNVMSVKGPHVRNELERAARLGWGRIVSCYESTARNAKGIVELELAVAAAGKVTAARPTRSTFRNRKLEACLTKLWKSIAMPKARAGSIIRMEIHLAPGDP